MKLRALPAIAALAILLCCKPAGESTSTADTLLMEEDTLASVAVQDDQPPPNISYYWEEGFNDTKSFMPFDVVYQQAREALKLRDSLFYVHPDQSFTHDDSILFMPYINDAHAGILGYAEQVRSKVEVKRNKFPRRRSALRDDDESFDRLGESSSTTLNNVDFMFLGGAPFITREPDVFKDASGNPETHYKAQIPENAEYFFNYVYAQHPVPMELTYGPPLHWYEGPDVEINGIGSIKHNLKERLQVWFLTADGAVPATLIDVTMKLGDEYGCVSDNTAYTFACSKDIEPGAIFGVFSSTDKISLDKATRAIFGSYLWEYDLDGDGQADMVCIQSAFSGAAGDGMPVAIWYVMIDGQWTVLDYATEPDCT